MVSLFFSILVTLATLSSDATTSTKDNTKKQSTSTTSPVGGIGTQGGTSTWENGTL